VAANPAAPDAVLVPRGSVARAARERHVTVARNDCRVTNSAGFGGIGGARAVLVGNARERSVARPLAAGCGRVSGCRSAARGAGKGRNAADGPGRCAMSPPLPSVATALDSRCQVCGRSGAESSRGGTCAEHAADGWRPDHGRGSPPRSWCPRRPWRAGSPGPSSGSRTLAPDSSCPTLTVPGAGPGRSSSSAVITGCRANTRRPGRQRKR
jgi:hypothetical protein